MDIRKILIIFVVGILFAVLVFSLIEAVYPQPKWDDFCDERGPIPVKPGTVEREDCEVIEISEEDKKACDAKDGYIDYTYDSRGCATSSYCETCQKEFDQSREQYNQVVFYISAVLALIAIFVGMYLPANTNTLNEWIGTGFMLGGVFALFFGTIRSFGDLGRFVRPIVIFIELALVIFLAYKKVGNLREDKKK